jgi:hypothetical protein
MVMLDLITHFDERAIRDELALSQAQGLCAGLGHWHPTSLTKCRIPDDCIDSKRYPLFMARAVLKELIESLQSTQGVKPC